MASGFCFLNTDPRPDQKFTPCTTALLMPVPKGHLLNPVLQTELWETSTLRNCRWGFALGVKLHLRQRCLKLYFEMASSRTWQKVMTQVAKRNGVETAIDLLLFLLAQCRTEVPRISVTTKKQHPVPSFAVLPTQVTADSTKALFQ